MKRKQIIIILLSILGILMFFCGCKENTEEKDVFVEKIEEGLDSFYGDESFGIDATVDKDLRNYRLIALFGIDNGNRNDINMIISLNKTDGTAKIVSIIRDSYMQVSEATDEEPAEYKRCNVGYERDGKYEAMKILNRNLDLNIRECICVDWACAAKLVDELGGVEVEIQNQSMLDAINNTIATFPEGDAELVPGTGVQRLSGWQMVQYLRVRKYKGGNTIKRVKNNQELFMKLYNQAKSMSSAEIVEVYDAIADDLDTNMSRKTLTDTLAQIATIDIEAETATWPYDWVRMKDSKNDYRTPNTLISNVKELHKVLFGQENYQPSTTVQQIHNGMIEAEENLKVLNHS